MSRIYHDFPNREAARNFADAVYAAQPFGISIFDSEEEASMHDPFPYALNVPIVHVDATELLSEDATETLAHSFGGRYAGT